MVSISPMLLSVGGTTFIPSDIFSCPRTYMLWNGVLDLKAVELGDIVMADHPLIGLGTAREVTVDKLG